MVSKNKTGDLIKEVGKDSYYVGENYTQNFMNNINC